MKRSYEKPNSFTSFLKDHPLLSIFLGIFIILILISFIQGFLNGFSESERQIEMTQKGIGPNDARNALIKDLNNFLLTPPINDLVTKYTFEEGSTKTPTGTVKLWVKTDFFYDLSESQKKDLVYGIGRTMNIKCADYGYQGGCATEFYSKADRLIAEKTIWGTVKIY